MSESFEFQGIFCQRSPADPSTFFYLPGEPEPETDPMGRPTLTLWVSDRESRLMVGTRWAVDAERLEELRLHIAETFEDLEPALIRLSMAPVTMEGVTLSLGDGEGNFKEIKTVKSSGYTPFSAIFNEQFPEEETSGVTAALNGREGFLKVSYVGVLAGEVTVKVSIAGDVEEDIAGLGEDVSFARCLEQIETALEEGRLILEKTETAEAPAEVYEKVEISAKEKAAQIMMEMIRSAGTGADRSFLEASASFTGEVPLRVERSTDVGTWFAGGTGTDHVRVLGTAPVEPRQQEEETRENVVKPGFDPADIPVAFIQVILGNEKAMLRGPGFEAVTLSGSESKGPLVVNTHYKTGGSPFQAEMLSPEPGGWILQPEHLGLKKIVVDGTGPEEAGARKARVHVHYRPTGSGPEDERTLYFRDNEWTAQWYMVTRSSGLGGSLEWEWKETAKDGKITRHPSVITDRSEIKL